MRKSLLLFFLFMMSIVLWKITEAKENEQLDDTAVEELITGSEIDKIAEK